jgi:NitT/TauT family transport system substrate-binding protein
MERYRSGSAPPTAGAAAARQVSLALGLALAVGLAGCTSARPPAAPAAPAPAGGTGADSAAPVAAANSASPSAPLPAEPVRIVYTTISAAQSPFWLALEGGYFREQGLDVGEMPRLEPGAPLLAAMRSGEVEFVAAGGPSLVVGALQGLETLIIGSTMGIMEGAVVARPEIRTADDLRGKTIAVSRLKAISDVMARVGTQRLGLQPDVDVFTRGTGGLAEALAALETGVVDAASVNMPATYEARRRGYPVVVDVTAMRIPFASGTVGVTRSTLDRRPEVAERVLRALAQAVHRFKTDPEYAGQVVGRYGQTDDADAIRATLDVFGPNFNEDPYPEPASIQTLLDVEENPAARTAKPEDVSDTRAAEAVRRSGFLTTLTR